MRDWAGAGPSVAGLHFLMAEQWQGRAYTPEGALATEKDVEEPLGQGHSAEGRPQTGGLLIPGLLLAYCTKEKLVQRTSGMQSYRQTEPEDQLPGSASV